MNGSQAAAVRHCLQEASLVPFFKIAGIGHAMIALLTAACCSLLQSKCTSDSHEKGYLGITACDIAIYAYRPIQIVVYIELHRAIRRTLNNRSITGLYF
jgi:hypothetical protein